MNQDQLMNEADEALNAQPDEAGNANTDAGEGVAPFLRDLTEDDVYDRLSQVTDFPTRLQALESRLFGSLGPLNERLQGIEKALGQQTAFDTEALAPLKEYDEELYKRLSETLPKAIRANQLDEATLQPFLAPMQEQLMDTMATMLAKTFYSPEEVNEIIPDVKDGVFDPQTERQKAFVDWYGRQPYETQQALSQIGPDWVRAVRQFERWEKEQTAAAQEKAKASERRLAAGTQPKGRGRKPAQSGPQTPEEAFAAGFNEVFNSLGR